MIRFKGCPKCHGDLIDGRDHYDLSCIQCGRYLAIDSNGLSNDGEDSARLNTDLAELLAA